MRGSWVQGVNELNQNKRYRISEYLCLQLFVYMLAVAFGSTRKFTKHFVAPGGNMRKLWEGVKKLLSRCQKLPEFRRNTAYRRRSAEV